jgi:ABC-2 type transport system ATP-binding protein
MWDIIEQLVAAGTTILLTTQDMDEADRLADKIIVIDGGKIIAEGTSDELKRRVGSERLEITIAETSSFETAKRVVAGGDEGMHLDSKTRTLILAATKGDGVHQLKQVLSGLDEAGVGVENVSFRHPTLDDVFLALTGHTTTTEQSNGQRETEKSGGGVNK